MSRVVSNILLPATSEVGLRSHYAEVASRLRARPPIPPRAEDYGPDGTVRIVDCKPYDAFASAALRPRACVVALDLSEHEKTCLFLESMHALRSCFLSPLGSLTRSLSIVFGIPELDIKSDRRLGPLVRVRSIGMATAYRLGLGSLPKIGRAFGGRDHTTVLHAVRRLGDVVDSALKLYPEFIPSQ
jgi:hypothetical protein